MAIAEFDGHTIPNAYGHLPLVELDPAAPCHEGRAEQRLLGSRGRCYRSSQRPGAVHRRAPNVGPRLARSSERWQATLRPRERGEYGEWLGRRYKEKGFIWILGGDRAIENDTQKRSRVRDGNGAPKRGRRCGSTTFHPPGADWAPPAGSTTTIGSTSICGKTVTASILPGATTRRELIMIADP